MLPPQARLPPRGQPHLFCRGTGTPSLRSLRDGAGRGVQKPEVHPAGARGSQRRHSPGRERHALWAVTKAVVFFFLSSQVLFSWFLVFMLKLRLCSAVGKLYALS